jgi:hypothetical protein
MVDFDFRQKEYESFVNSVSRFKWIILLTILLSCSSILDLYSKSDTTASQIRNVYLRKLFTESFVDFIKQNKTLDYDYTKIKFSDELKKCDEKNDVEYEDCVKILLEHNKKNFKFFYDLKILEGKTNLCENEINTYKKEQCENVKNAIFRVSDFYSKKEKVIELLENINSGTAIESSYKELITVIEELKKPNEALSLGDIFARERITKRTIPLLNMEIEINDFLTIIQIMLTVFVLSLWLVLENLKFQIKNLIGRFSNSDEKDLKILIRSNFLFNVSDEHLTITIILQYISIFFPFISIFTATLVDILSISDSLKGVFFGNSGLFNNGFGSASNQIIRSIIGILSNIIILWFSYESACTAKQIDSLVK